MADDLYCSRADVTERLPPGAIGSRGELVASSSSSSNEIEFDGHGLETGTAVTVRAVDHTGATLPAPLEAGTTYYAIRLTNATFKLATSSANATAGTAIDLTTSGVSVVVMREPQFDDVIEFYSRWADGILPGHLVPLEAPIHPVVRGVVADCSAATMLHRGGQDSAVVTAAEIAGKAILERYAAGRVLRGAPVTASANLAITASASTTSERNWAPNGSGSLP